MAESQVDCAPAEELLQVLIFDDKLERLEDFLAEFNLFDVLGVARRENQHSALLAWLLDPRGSHGLRDYFLRGFLMEAAAEARSREVPDITALIADGWQLQDVEVATERHNIDILLIARTDEFVCLIENKIGSGERCGQLSRYLSTVDEEYGDLLPFPIYLTPEGEEPEAEDDAERYVPFDYGKVAGLVDRVLRARRSTISSSVASFLEHYSHTLRRRVLATTDNIDVLAYQIYSNHREAIDLIIRARSTPGTMGWDILERAIEQYAPDLKPDHHHHSKRMLRFFAPSLGEVQALNEGRDWTESGRMLLFEFKYEDEEIRLYAMVGPGPQETRERLHQLQRKESGAPFRSRSRKLGKRHHWLYRKLLLSRKDYERFDPDEIGPTVEKAISDFYEDDYWPLVNAIRKEFGCPRVSPEITAETTPLG